MAQESLGPACGAARSSTTTETRQMGEVGEGPPGASTLRAFVEPKR